MKTIGFIIPFKSKSKSKHWMFDCALLNRTLHSLINQSDQSYLAYVVYSDMPDQPVEHENIKWVHFPFPFVKEEAMADQDFIKSHLLQGWAEGSFDQGKRVLFGSRVAKQDGCKYIMSLDADDLISSRFVEKLQEFVQTKEFGWYVDKGYNYKEGSNYLVRVPSNMNCINGSVNIVRSDLVPEPDFDDTSLQNFTFFSSHAYLKNRIWQLYGKPLQPLPFYAIVYVRHSYGGWINNGRRKKSLALREVLKSIVGFKFISRGIKQEFNIYKVRL